VRAFFLVLAFAAQCVWAQQYPARAIKIVVAFPAGGGSDLAARVVGQRLSESFGQPVIVENRVGANGNIGAEAVARAAPDGYTLVMGSNATSRPIRT
jgi:tripartite-type tricarboxylate transporter receptor subunit TctC